MLARPAVSDYPFSLGIASGEPASDGFVLWTRLAPRPLEVDGGMPREVVAVRWQVAEDSLFNRVVAAGDTLARPEAAHAVHVEVQGLRPDRPYWYRFQAAREISPAGRTRTAPALGAAVSRLRLAFASCQHYETGFFATYRQMVADDPDLIVFLGDYIYESSRAAPNDRVRDHGTSEPLDLAGYRARYALYKTDLDLQRAHAQAPWIVTWDDHEVENDYANAFDENLGDPWTFLRRRAAAYQAYYEHMPLRRRSQSVGPSMLLHRAIDWGGLAQLQVLDNRQFRDDQPCQLPGVGRGRVVPHCAERDYAERSMLGQAQEAWLLDTLSSSSARWNLLAQQLRFAPFQQPITAGASEMGFFNDGWEGYRANWRRIVDRWTSAKVPNPIVLSGDIHSFWANDIHGQDTDSPIVASEFVSGSISSLPSGTHAEWMARVRLNPHVRFYEDRVRGHGLIDLTETACEVTFRSVADARDPKSAAVTLARFAVEPGRAGVQAA